MCVCVWVCVCVCGGGRGVTEGLTGVKCKLLQEGDEGDFIRSYTLF